MRATWQTQYAFYYWIQCKKTKIGYPGTPMRMADIATILSTDVLRLDAGDPQRYDRDRSSVATVLIDFAQQAVVSVGLSRCAFRRASAIPRCREHCHVAEMVE
ncbi:hypothetical protein [Paraburkholderia phytofirmans]|uniref:hypothetical protein n=1 Tax=Paraburkholderia phytofirmans TaxID=261302 RepID=UPI0038B89CA8